MTDLSRLEPNWNIRPFRFGDAPAARRLVETVWHEHFHRHPDPFVRDFIYTRLSDITGAIKSLDDRECEMVRMFVASAHRNRGIERAIADELIRFARIAGYDRIRLSSNNSLVASHRLYERLGFQPVLPWEPGGETYSRHYALRISNL
jgi:GNAT superfamily N-acetyltransferase